MIAPLRRAHYRVWIVLPFILFAILLAGLTGRRSATPVNPAFEQETVR